MKGVRLSGTAGSYDEVLEYSANLKASGVYGRIEIMQLKSRGGSASGDVSFQMYAYLISGPSEAGGSDEEL